VELPDRIRLNVESRIVVLKAVRSYIDQLLYDPKPEPRAWADAQDAYKIARSLAIRTEGRRKRWSEDFYLDFDKSTPIAEIDKWIQDLTTVLKTRPTQEAPAAPLSSASQPLEGEGQTVQG